MSETPRTKCERPNCTICLDAKMLRAFKAKGLPDDELAWINDLLNREAHENMDAWWYSRQLSTAKADLAAAQLQASNAKYAEEVALAVTGELHKDLAAAQARVKELEELRDIQAGELELAAAHMKELGADLQARVKELEAENASVGDWQDRYGSSEAAHIGKDNLINELKARVRELEAAPATPREDARRRILKGLMEMASGASLGLTDVQLFNAGHRIGGTVTVGRLCDFIAAEFPESAPAVTRERVREAVKDELVLKGWNWDGIVKLADGISDRLGVE